MQEVSWRDEARGRAVVLREGLLADAPELLADAGWDEFDLLTTQRALEEAAVFEQAAEATHLVAAAQVPEAAAAVLEDVGSDRLVALGGGRVIDSAKAVAAVRGGEVAAVPTTLSGAPMTAIHRLPAGQQAPSGVRPALVLADPLVMTSAPEPRLRATAMNALAHAAESLYTPLADEESRKDALRAAELIACALDADRADRDRSELALGALLAGSAVDRAGIALHHVLGQTLVRVLDTPHAETYAALLPATIAAMREHAPEQIAALAAALGSDPEDIGDRIRELAGDRRLGELGADADRIDEVVEAAVARPELFQMTPGELDRADLEAILRAAW
jgi:alcohol dehydrogenase class IV